MLDIVKKLQCEFIKLIGLYLPTEIGKRSIVRNHVKKILKGSSKSNLKNCEVERDALKFLLNMTEEIDLWLYFTGWWEKTDCQIAFDSIRSNNIVFDVGANIGSFSIRAAKKLNPRGKIYAFEPNPITLNRLYQNIKLNNFDNIIVVEKALGSEIGQKTLYLPKNGKSGGASLHNKWLKSAGISQETNSEASFFISTITLDNFFSINNLNRVDFIKIDVEGYEPEVLLGGRKIIEKYKPRLMMECNKIAIESGGWQVSELLKLIEELGYNIFKRKLLSKTLWPVKTEKDIKGDCNLHCYAKK